MSVLDVLEIPSSELRAGCRLIMAKEVRTPEIQRVCDDLLQTAAHLAVQPRGCAGLAAPQIGHLVRAVVVALRPRKWQVLLNPEIVTSDIRRTVSEGCLSVPVPASAPVVRFMRVRYRFMDRYGHQRMWLTHGVAAQAVQHEVDHLDGKLFIDRFRPPRVASEAAIAPGFDELRPSQTDLIQGDAHDHTH